MPLLHLGQLQVEGRRRRLARMMIPPVAEQDSADVEKHAGDTSRILHRLLLPLIGSALLQDVRSFQLDRHPVATQDRSRRVARCWAVRRHSRAVDTATPTPPTGRRTHFTSCRSGGAAVERRPHGARHAPHSVEIVHWLGFRSGRTTRSSSVLSCCKSYLSLPVPEHERQVVRHTGCRSSVGRTASRSTVTPLVHPQPATYYPSSPNGALSLPQDPCVFQWDGDALAARYHSHRIVPGGRSRWHRRTVDVRSDCPAGCWPRFISSRTAGARRREAVGAELYSHRLGFEAVEGPEPGIGAGLRDSRPLPRRNEA